MKIADLTKIVSEIEGKKVEVSVGNIREVFAALAKTLATNEEASKAWDKYVSTKRPKKVK